MALYKPFPIFSDFVDTLKLKELQNTVIEYTTKIAELEKYIKGNLAIWGDPTILWNDPATQWP